MVARPYVFHSPSAKEPSPIPELMVGISHLIWSALISDFPLNHPTARKTVPFGLLSPTAHVAVTSTAASTTAPAGPIAEQITLKTNDANNPLIQVTVTGTVASPLELAPNRVRIEGIAVGQSASQRVLIRGAKPFRILGVDGIGAGVTVELPTTAGKLLPVQVITVKFAPTKPGPVDRDLLGAWLAGVRGLGRCEEDMRVERDVLAPGRRERGHDLAAHGGHRGREVVGRQQADVADRLLRPRVTEHRDRVRPAQGHQQVPVVGEGDAVRLVAHGGFRPR